MPLVNANLGQEEQSKVVAGSTVMCERRLCHCFLNNDFATNKKKKKTCDFFILQV